MAVTDQQKLDFLLKKIGYTKTKTGSVVGTGAISGTPKQPFAEAIPSPLVVPNSSLWNEAGSIPATPPGSDTPQVKVYLAATSGLRMTADATSSGQRAYIAYSTYGNTSSTRLTNWIDTQFGASYIIKVYKGDPNSGGVNLSAAGSGANDGWFFDYSAGVLNFNDTSVPSGVTDTNIYIVGYRYIGQTGAPTSGISTFSYKDLFVERHLSVGGVSTFSSDVEFNGNVSIAGTLTYEDVSNIDSVGIITAQKDIHVGAGVSAVGIITANSGMRVGGGVIEAQSGENKIPSLYAGLSNLPNSTDYHGLFAHVHSNGKAYYSHDVGATITVTVGVDNVGGQSTGVFYFNGTEKPALFPVTRNTTYVFNQDHATNEVYGGANHPLMFSTGPDGDHNGHGHYLTGITYKLDGVAVTMAGYTSGFNAATTRRVEWKVPTTAPLTLYYWCHHHTGQGNSLSLSDGAYLELVEKDKFGVVGLGTEVYNIGILTATSADITGDLDVDGHTDLDNLSVAGVSTFAGFIDLNADLDVDGHTNLDNVSVSGVATFASGTTFTGAIDANGDLDVEGQTNLDHVSISGVTTFTNALDVNSDIDVDGHTNLDNVSIAGVSTFTGSITANGAIDLNADLDVDGHTNLDNVSVAGVTTFAGNARFDSTITAGGSAGTNGYYLKTTGSGVEWAPFPSIRTRDTQTASSGQTSFSFNYNVGYVDVFVNGVKLTDSEFTATNGTSVVLAVGSFVGDIVELVSYNTVSASGGAQGIANVVEDVSPQLGGNLDLFNKNITGTGNININGSVTATNLIGDGSGLTNVVGSGSGIVVLDSSSTVGTAGTIDFGDGLNVSPIQAGVVTVTTGVSTAEVRANTLVVSGVSTLTGTTNIGDLDVDGHTNLDHVSISGVTTFASATHATTLNATTVNATTFVGNGDFVELDVDGHTNLDNVSVAGVTTFTGAITAADIRHDSVNIKNAAGSATLAVFHGGGGVQLNFNNTNKFVTTNTGAVVTGILTATSFRGDGSQLTGITAGVSTSDVRTNTLNVSGISTLTNLIVTGVSTLTNIDVDDFIDVGNNIQLGNAGVATATQFVGNLFVGSGGTADINGDLDVDGHTNLDNVTIAGVATFSSTVNANEFSGAASANNLTSGTVPSARLSGTYSITNSGSAASIIPVNETSDTENFVVFTNTATGSQTPKTNTGLKFNASSGALTAVSFVGDGSGLSGVTAEGTGIAIREDNNPVGTASTINFADSISVTPVSSGITTVGIDTSQLNAGKLNVSGISTFNNDISIDRTIKHIGDTTTSINFPTNLNISFVTNNQNRLQIGPLGQFGIGGATNYGTDGQVLTSRGSSAAVQWTTVASSVGITTNIGGSFTATAGQTATIDTFTGYGADDKVIEYTIFFTKAQGAGNAIQSQKLLVMRDGTNLYSTQFAVMFSSSLLMQCDAIISSGNILLRATAETGVNGSVNYRVKREVM